MSPAAWPPGGAPVRAAKPALLANLALLLTLLCALVPLAPRMPGASLDESWLMGVNQAMAQGAAFGRDLVFTYGPYASIYTRAYHPATDSLMLWSSAYLALSFALACAVMTRGRPWACTVALGLIVAGLLPYPADTLLFSYPLIAVLAVARLVDEQALRQPAAQPRVWLLALLLLPFGLLPLIKGTVLILCLAVLVIGAGYLVAQGQRQAAALCLAVPLLGACGFWLASGQELANLPRYLQGMVPIASGYTEAMAIPGKSSAIWNYLAFCGLFLVAIAGDRARAGRTRWFLVALFAVFFFIVFKGSFVRHDSRAIGAGASLILATVVLAASSRARWVWLLCLVASLTWWDITRHHFKPQDLVVQFLESTYRQAWSGLSLRLQAPEWPRNEFEAAMRNIRDRAGFPLVEGGADIYGHGQTLLIASGNRWNTRPVLQSYSAYLPALAEMNRQHLLGADAPDHLFFRLEPIDQRFPSLDDGPSWPDLLARYQPVRVQGEYLHLDRRPLASTTVQLERGAPRTHALGERVPVPSLGGPIYAEIELQPSRWGALAHLLFKPSRLEIEVEQQDGSRKRFRYIAGMGRSPFMISPLVENTEEFALLYGEPGHLAARQVKAFTITAAGRGASLWKEGFEVRFSRAVPPPEPVAADRLQVFDRVVKDAATEAAGPVAACTASIDSINGRSPAPAQLDGAGALQVRGWAAASMAPPALPDAVLIVLTDGTGRRRFVQARQTPRPDVGAHFKSPTLDGSGYAANLDLSGLSGRHILGLALRRADKIDLCPQPVVTVEVGLASARAGPSIEPGPAVPAR
jgi:hypothetical protein